MAMARSPERTLLVEFGQVKAFSDIHGRHVVRLDGTIRRRQDLAQRLQTAGCKVDLGGRDWHEAGDLTPPSLPGGTRLGKRVPKSAPASEPRLDARYVDRGKGGGSVELTNHGPGPVLELAVELDPAVSGLTRLDESLPPLLPAGKSVRAFRVFGSLGSPIGSYLTFTATGKTEAGAEIRQELFVSMGL